MTITHLGILNTHTQFPSEDGYVDNIKTGQCFMYMSLLDMFAYRDKSC